ncbi:MAG TPA: T9SS type A sorting domain-containing protein, partial [bacterium (Candidatus Stahlbacteria)]|nr:T9SS type A sorting domain-containing protein [Candidatus Stahlbacteria bacterium]
IHMLIQFSVRRPNHYFSRDGGQTWSDTSLVTGDYGVDKPWMVVNRNEIYIAWQQISGQTGIMFAKSTDYGRTFTKTRIWNRTGITALCMDESENLHLGLVAWNDRVYYRKSTDKGASWSAEKYLADYWYQSGYGDRAPINSITAHGDIVFMTWVDNSRIYQDWDIKGIRSTDSGNTWSSPFIINDSLDGGQCKGWATFDPYGGLHVIYYHCPFWPTSSTTPFSLRYQYSPDSGITFNPSVRVSDTCAPSHADFMGEYHIVRTDSLYVYAIWTCGRNPQDNDLYFSKALISQVKVGEGMDYQPGSEPISIPTIWHGPVMIKSNLKINRLSIYDCSGRIVRTISKGENEIRLDSRLLPPGVFFLRIETSENTLTSKVVNLR